MRAWIRLVERHSQAKTGQNSRTAKAAYVKFSLASTHCRAAGRVRRFVELPFFSYVIFANVAPRIGHAILLGDTQTCQLANKMVNMYSLLSRERKHVTVLRGPFRGASLFLIPKQSRRKIFGVYEHVLNDWLEKVLPEVNVVWDVGANDGYFCFGCAHRILQHQGRAAVVAFEPGMMSGECMLEEASSLPMYRQVDFHFVPKLVSSENSHDSVTLQQAYEERPELWDARSLVKVDVEGAELDVLAGAGPLLRSPTQWVVEVHGEHLVDPVFDVFRKAGRDVEAIEPLPHWLLGAEQRTIYTCWVVTS